MKQFSNEITYASMLGGFSDALDKEKVEKNLNERGYETPKSDLWYQIFVEINGKMVGKIYTQEKKYCVMDGNFYKWDGIDNFLNHLATSYHLQG
tara:strand:+ start:221 stop:502 length:282 start_codon:yes stop_codon:yes gene_type:complete